MLEKKKKASTLYKGFEEIGVNCNKNAMWLDFKDDLIRVANDKKVLTSCQKWVSLFAQQSQHRYNSLTTEKERKCTHA